MAFAKCRDPKSESIPKSPRSILQHLLVKIRFRMIWLLREILRRRGGINGFRALNLSAQLSSTGRPHGNQDDLVGLQQGTTRLKRAFPSRGT